MAQVSVKHRSLSLKLKVEILKAVDQKIDTKTKIAAQYGIPKSTLSTIIKNREKIEKAVTDGECENIAWKKVKKIRGAAFPKLEKALFLWIKKLLAKNVPVDGVLLKRKAEEFALQMGIDKNISFSDGWVQNFKKRHNLSFRKICGESGAADPTAAAAWKEGRLKRILTDYKPEDIYNADETGLFFKALPTNTLAFKNQKCTGGKLSKVRITLLICSNMTGSDKLPLLVIGKAKKPRCFKGLRTLPVEYVSNGKAWMTSNIFSDWVRKLDRRMGQKKKKVLLIVDNCPAHPSVEDLKNVKLEFLPPNLTSLIQPMDQGVIQVFKKNYKQMLLQRIIITIDNDKEYQVDLLKAIHMSAASWDSVSSDAIGNCFRHAGFGPLVPPATRDQSSGPISSEAAQAQSDPETAESVQSGSSEAAPAEADLGTGCRPTVDDDDDSGQLLLEALRAKTTDIPRELTFSDLVEVDSFVECNEDFTDEDILSRSMDTANDDNDSSEDDDDLRLINVQSERPSVKTVTESLDVVRRFLELQNNADELLKMTAKIEKAILSSFSKELRQCKITDFM